MRLALVGHVTRVVLAPRYLLGPRVDCSGGRAIVYLRRRRRRSPPLPPVYAQTTRPHGTHVYTVVICRRDHRAKDDKRWCSVCVVVLVMSPSGYLSSRREASMAAMVARVHVRTGLVRAIRGEAGRACGR